MEDHRATSGWPGQLPREPKLPEGSPLEKELREALLGLEREGFATLPQVLGLPSIALARWLYRAFLVGSGAWPPFIFVDGRLAGATEPVRVETIESALGHARGGWLFLSAPHPGDGQRLREARGDVRVLLERSAPPIEAPPAFVQRLRALDEVHGVASDPDPALRRLRRRLKTIVMGAGREQRELIHLCGPVGCGRASLARWAHREMNEVSPLRELDGAVSIEPAASWLARDIDVMRAAQREALCVALSAEPSTQRVLYAAQRPRDALSREAFADLIGEGPAMASALQSARVMGPDRELDVLIQGARGVGKELLARALHELTGGVGPFVVFDMAARNDGVVEAELFGSVRGGFTGAQDRRGAARQADGGTLFLDEIGNISLSLQAKLLRLLEAGEVLPVGSDKPIHVNIRVVAATNADLEQMAREDRFRPDLLDRLRGAHIDLPALREHPEDIPALVSHFLASTDPERGWSVNAEAMALLTQDRWEGNVRALKSSVRRAFNRAAAEGEGALILPRHLDAGLQGSGAALGYITSSQPDELGEGPDGPMLTRALSLRWHVPPLRTRSAESRRHLIYHLCAGRVLSEDLVDRLVGQPWWRGEVAALQSWLAVLHRAAPGLITETSLPLGLGEVSASDRAASLVLMTHAAIDDYTGEVVGQARSLDAGVVLIGRGNSPWIVPPSGETGKARLRWLNDTLNGVRGAFVALDDVPALSRAHLLIERTPSGFLLRQVPNTNGHVELRVPGGQGWQLMSAGANAVSGGGAALRFREPEEPEPFLTLYLFDGPLAVQRLGVELVSASSRGPAHETRRGRGAARSTPPVDEGPTRWTLTHREREAMVEMVLACARSGQSRAGFFRRWLAERSEEQGLERLTGFLLAEGREDKIGTYVHQRIFVDWEDPYLGPLLAEALAATGEAEALRARLGAAIRRLLEGLNLEG